MTRVLQVVVLVLFVVALTVFTVQNIQTVRLTFFKWFLEMPLSITIVLIYIFGAVSGGVLFSMLKTLYKAAENKEK